MGTQATPSVLGRSAAWFIDALVLTTALYVIRLALHPQRPAALATGVAITAIYIIGSLLIWSSTPGKIALGLRVTNFDNGSRLAAGACFSRWASAYWPFLIPSQPAWLVGAGFSIDSVFGLSRPWHRCLHDRVARSIVTKVEPAETSSL